MCDTAQSRGLDWEGWLPMPKRFTLLPAGPWIHLSYRLNKSVPRADVLPEPSFRRIKSLPQDPLNVTEMLSIDGRSCS